MKFLTIFLPCRLYVCITNTTFKTSCKNFSWILVSPKTFFICIFNILRIFLFQMTLTYGKVRCPDSIAYVPQQVFGNLIEKVPVS